MTGESTTSLFGGSSVGSDTILRALRQAEADAKVKAIVLRVDSPGGSALASDLIWREIVKSKKPVVVSMGDTAASGGYYVSMGAKKIFVEPGTLTGSIGVVGGKLALRGLFDKLGVTTETISRGKTSGTLSITDPFSLEEREGWKRLMLDTYQQFTTKAAEGRHMDLKKLEGLAQGRLFTGRMAVANGLADQLGTLDDTIAEARSQAGIPSRGEDRSLDPAQAARHSRATAGRLSGRSRDSRHGARAGRRRSLRRRPAQTLRRAGRHGHALQRAVQVSWRFVKE